MPLGFVVSISLGYKVLSKTRQVQRAPHYEFIILLSKEFCLSKDPLMTGAIQLISKKQR